MDELAYPRSQGPWVQVLVSQPRTMLLSDVGRWRSQLPIPKLHILLVNKETNLPQDTGNLPHCETVKDIADCSHHDVQTKSNFPTLIPPRQSAGGVQDPRSAFYNHDKWNSCFSASRARYLLTDRGCTVPVALIRDWLDVCLVRYQPRLISGSWVFASSTASSRVYGYAKCNRG